VAIKVRLMHHQGMQYHAPETVAQNLIISKLNLPQTKLMNYHTTEKDGRNLMTWTVFSAYSERRQMVVAIQGLISDLPLIKELSKTCLGPVDSVVRA